MIKKVILYISMFFVIQYMAIGLVAIGNLILGREAGNMDTPALLISQGLFSVICITVFLVLRWAPVSTRYWNTRPLSAIIWCVIAAIGTIAPSMWLQSFLDFLPDINGENLLEIMQQRWGYVVIGILSPWAEEVVFRGAILHTLLQSERGLGRWTAITISALLFAIAHLNPAQMPHAFLIGLLLGWVYERSRSLIPCVVLHCANNTLAYLMTAAYPASDITLRQILGGSQRAELMAVGFSLLILLPALYQLRILLRRK